MHAEVCSLVSDDGAKKTVYTHTDTYISRGREYMCDKTLPMIIIWRGI